MRSCLTCQRKFEDGRLICADDGDMLCYEGKPTSDSGRILSGRYVLGNLLGEGGMGRVFEAQRVNGGEVVAVKLLKGDLSAPPSSAEPAEKRFRIEAEAAAALNHPGVVKVFEFDQTPEGRSFIAMERLRGATFDELRRAGKLADLEKTIMLLSQVCEILEVAHQKGIVHRDLKPSNLFLHRQQPDSSLVKVLDFGIAKILDRAGDSLTTTGEFLGTLMYMAPDQLSGKGVSPAMDVYSLGVILFEALAGRVPFEARSPLELLRLHASTPAPSLSAFRPEVSVELDLVVARCLMKQPEHRFQNAGEVHRALNEALWSRTRTDHGKTAIVQVTPGSWVGVVLDDRYEIQEWLGAGRFGSDIFRALHLRTGANVAVRIWKTGQGPGRDSLLAAYKKEARAMGVKHPNLISILDLGFTDACIYLVTELVESISLRTLQVRKGPLAPDLAVELVKSAAEALAALHQKGIVSGGLSPETIRVQSGPAGPEKLLLTPMGFSSLKELELLSAGVAGLDPSAHYLSPEQRAGREADPRSDLYSLALILLELLSGELPDRADGAREKSQPKGAGDEHDLGFPLPRLPSPAWNAFFARALARDPSRRFPDAAAFVAALPLPAG